MGTSVSVRLHLLNLLTLAALATATSDQDACTAQHGGKHAVQAIQAFCAKTDMVVPSSYAQTGHSVVNARVFISSNCSPAEWVPQYWCLTQFYSLCAAGDFIDGSTSGRYGKGGCQYFELTK
ncbi:hypothetical protein B0A54_03279 [Friedmanniomyces endolithicus]|uniref:Uncharacterized protein n=1 Tax=Friedmanniomyces endolithicus TaxID=329885 RepID=A0A4U0V888_9PEZI|nr:hypothetical protein B0A54_03279 [Friedmanniomyces endolithicus]